jgi:hypothetical protein
MTVMQSVARKATAKHDLLLNKWASGQKLANSSLYFSFRFQKNGLAFFGAGAGPIKLFGSKSTHSLAKARPFHY